MSTPTYLNKTEKITVTFYGWPLDTGEVAPPENPSSVSVKIFNTDTIPDTLLATASPVSAGSTGKYYYDWTPTTLGNFNVQFYATFADGSIDPVNNFFTVYEAVSAPPAGSTLISDQLIQLAGIIDPLYLDPSEIKVLYSDAENIQIVELIHKFSLEVQKIEKLDNTKTPPDEPSYVALEYIQAATACSLSRVYDDMTAGNDFSFRLGDLQVDNRPAFKQTVNRANATTWCELAAVLRKEMVANQVGMKAVHKGRGGGDRTDLIPNRRLKRYDRDPSLSIYAYDANLANPIVNVF